MLCPAQNQGLHTGLWGHVCARVQLQFSSPLMPRTVTNVCSQISETKGKKCRIQTQWPESMDYSAENALLRIEKKGLSKHKYLNPSLILFLLYKFLKNPTWCFPSPRTERQLLLHTPLLAVALTTKCLKPTNSCRLPGGLSKRFLHLLGSCLVCWEN